MLKISIIDSREQRRLILEGALIPSSLMHLRTAWLRACARRQGRKIVLEFRNMTDVSAEGEAALWELMNRGARFASGGIVNKQILLHLISRNKPRESAGISSAIES